MPCVIKYEYEEGEKLPIYKQELWCGKTRTRFDWVFTDSQHAALADKPICNSCRSAIIRGLNNG